MKHAYGGLGFRLARAESVLARPSADISEAELNVLLPRGISSGVFGTGEIRQTSGSSLMVELAPCITGVFRTSARRQGTGAPPPSGESPDRLQASVRLAKLLDEAKALNDEIIAKTGGGSKSSDVRRRHRAR